VVRPYWKNCLQTNSVNVFLRRNINSCPSHIKKMCYLAMVWPILEYSSVVWSPFTNSNIHRVEMAQRRAARFIMHNYLPRASVTEMLNNLNLPSLEERCNSLVMTHKILHNFAQVESRVHLIPTQSYTRGHNQCFLQPQSTVYAPFTHPQLSFGTNCSVVHSVRRPYCCCVV